MEISKLIDLFEKRREEREPRLRDFFNPTGNRRYLVIPRVPNEVYTSCRNVEEVLTNNIAAVQENLLLDCCDDLPYLEPWIGVGVYANAFGSEYLWDTGGAPDALYRFKSLKEIRDVPDPDWRTAPIMQMVIDAIDHMKEKTRAAIPICLTDTQSAQDTATLILETTEFLVGCYTDPELIDGFLDKINRLIIEFSRVQAEHIGDELWARPGHGFVGLPFLTGIGVSDDNMVISSPEFNERFSFPRNAELAADFGGVAVHSCGNWTTSMKRIRQTDGLYMIDLALAGNPTDPSPCPGEDVRNAVSGHDVILKVRVGDDLQQGLSELSALFSGEQKIIVDFPYEEAGYEEKYRRYSEHLEMLDATAKGVTQQQGVTNVRN